MLRRERCHASPMTTRRPGCDRRSKSATGSDAIICAGLAAFVGFSVAEKLDVPALGAGMIPLTPTAEFPSSFLPPRRVPRWLNQFSHRFVAEMLWRAFRRAINEARVGVCGLPPRSKLWSAYPMLYGISPSLLPKPTDWPSNAFMCGQWVRPVDDWDAPQALQDFLSAGEAPIYVGFGSMVGYDRNVMRDAVVTAVAGRRALFYPGWSGTEGLELPKNFCLLEENSARLAVSPNLAGDSSWRFRNHALRRTCWHSFGRAAFRRRSALLGGAVAASRGCT